MASRVRSLTPALMFLVVASTGITSARNLTLEERIHAQEAIERVYYSHQVGTTKPFEEAVPRAVLERKVRTMLEQSAALEAIWNRPVTAEALQRETERIARGTRMPERLRELYVALGNDAFLFQETVARAALVDRLARSSFAADQKTHARAHARAAALRRDLLAGRIDPNSAHPDRSTAVMRRATSNRDLNLSLEEFEERASRLPAKVGEIGPLLEQEDGFSIDVVLERDQNMIRTATFRVPKEGWDEWWLRARRGFENVSPPKVALAGGELPDPGGRQEVDAAAADTCVDDTWDPKSLDDVPDPRSGHVVVWTGSEMIVWGGNGGGSYIRTGGRYDPILDAWAPTSLTNAPSARQSATAVWAGNVMVVWGGLSGFTKFNTGGRYDPQTDSWTATTTLNAPVASDSHTAIWTGTRMIVWGGDVGNSGGVYDPVADNWTSTTAFGAPVNRRGHSAVWTGSEMIVWGGDVSSSSVNTGGRFNPASNSWIATSTTGAPSQRTFHSAVWTGSVMVVWGGQPGGCTVCNTGGIYDPLTDSWTPTTTTDAPAWRSKHLAVWTGSRMLIWGGVDSYAELQSGGSYDPVHDVWTTISTTNSPPSRSSNCAIWTGDLMIVWGGSASGSYSFENRGGRYKPDTDTWTPTYNSPAKRHGYSLRWTGSQMLMWGGQNLATGQKLNSGFKYDPVIDVWTQMSQIGAPTPRHVHKAIWTGSLMVVYGGSDGVSIEPLNTGGRYDPIGDSWSPTSTLGAPVASGASYGAAVWTGRFLIVWGGSLDGNQLVNSGGRYDPENDTWLPTSTANAPDPRASPGADWTGRVMVIWGGSVSGSVTNTGGRYDALADSWLPTAMLGAPAARRGHSAVWTGSRMLVWGGQSTIPSPPQYYNDGGRYDPVADTWESMSIVGSPAPRLSHSAVWTGRQMVVWGGVTSTGLANVYLDSGGRYDPSTDTWAATSQMNAPSGRETYNNALWTGSEMIVLGGASGYAYLDSGSLYCACSGAVSSYYQDSDGDGYGDPGTWILSCAQPIGYMAVGGDCADADRHNWSPPSEARDLNFQDNLTLSWTEPLLQGGTTRVSYDVLRTANRSDFVTSATCIESDFTRTSTTDRSDPPTGGAYFYLVRAQNGCPGAGGSLGVDSAGYARRGRACP